MSRRGTNRTNQKRAARALQSQFPGLGYQTALRLLRAEELETDRCCVRCNDPLIEDDDGELVSVRDWFRFCQEFTAHDDLDDVLGVFAPSHQVDAGAGRSEDERYSVHPDVVDCARCEALVPTDVSIVDLLVLVECAAALRSLDWSKVGLEDQAEFLRAAALVWVESGGAVSQRRAEVVKRTVELMAVWEGDGQNDGTGPRILQRRDHRRGPSTS